MNSQTLVRELLYARDGGLCGFCKEPVAMADVDIDHVIPLKHGGETTPGNLRISHAFCNRSAGSAIATRNVHGLGLSEATRRELWACAIEIGRKARALAARDGMSVDSHRWRLLKEELARSKQLVLPLWTEGELVTA